MLWNWEDLIQQFLLFSVSLRWEYHKKYSRSFIKLRLSHWCHMDYFNDVLTTFLGLECGSCVAVYEGSVWISSKIYSNVFSEDQRRSYGFGTTWGWVINDRIKIFGWTIPLSLKDSIAVQWVSLNYIEEYAANVWQQHPAEDEMQHLRASDLNPASNSYLC